MCYVVVYEKLVSYYFFVVDHDDCKMCCGVIYRKMLMEIPGLTQDAGEVNPRLRRVNVGKSES